MLLGGIYPGNLTKNWVVSQFQGYWAKSLSTKSSLQSDMKLNVKMESSANVCGTE